MTNFLNTKMLVKIRMRLMPEAITTDYEADVAAAVRKMLKF